MSVLPALDLDTIQPDGTWTVTVEDAYSTQDFTLLTLALPVQIDQGAACGRYLLARCGAVTQSERLNNWDIYARRPIYAVSRGQGTPAAPTRGDAEHWRFVVPASDDPGLRWLAALSTGNQVNVIGPLGNSWSPPPGRMNLLLTSPAALMPCLLSAAEKVLDRGGRVAASVRTPGDITDLRRVVPWSMELRVARTDTEWKEQILEALPWTDTLLAVVAAAEVQPLADTLRLKRFHLVDEDASVLVLSDLLCGYGACLACAVPTAGGGYTRACVHGPVFALTSLAA